MNWNEMEFAPVRALILFILIASDAGVAVYQRYFSDEGINKVFISNIVLALMFLSAKTSRPKVLIFASDVPTIFRALLVAARWISCKYEQFSGNFVPHSVVVGRMTLTRKRASLFTDLVRLPHRRLRRWRPPRNRPAEELQKAQVGCWDHFFLYPRRARRWLLP